MTAEMLLHGWFDCAQYLLTINDKVLVTINWAAYVGRGRRLHFPTGVSDLEICLRERFGRDKTVFQTAWLYGYDVGRELR